ncbi:TonB family protein [Flagellimonas hymeniacidonis]|uniref:TonB family protein n=1 Tax=Flagellimonas hymeniacidonis TaxID=2603628 RepID=A0A5C8V790_9FLAO|nr:M56 family metallopeptidase [Flagellimonas hymeniacidonis]TXN37226.1 TonB family protein [Flagellimonas hymeniacidonis]
MIQYVLESLVFQLIFLLTYDLFLKKETFFQWNRIYLIGTFTLSLILPWIRIEALQALVPNELIVYPSFLWQLDEITVYSKNNNESFFESISWEHMVFGIGMLVMYCWFSIKLFQILRLKHKGDVHYHKDYTKIVVPKSGTAFSFFRNIFLGQDIKQDKQQQIIAHELVHVRQLHTIDLIFFELMRIIFWFNPLVYVYQSKASELHEFIADSEVSKGNKKEQYQLLLSDVFRTQNISFVNQFFKKSLIKKRIVMLQKEKSGKIYRLKYLLLLPVTVSMLLYTSCENEKGRIDSSIRKEKNESFLVVDDLNNMSESEKNIQQRLTDELIQLKSPQTLMVEDGSNSVKLYIDKGEIKKVEVQKNSVEDKKAGSKINGDPTPFNIVDKVPIFPGCENAEDQKSCFMEKIREHITTNFEYPEKAEEMGIQGNVNVLFTITREGQVTGIRMRGPHELLEEETHRIISKLPQMQPGKHQGRIVEVPFSIPIKFEL